MSYSWVKSANFSEGETLIWFPFSFLIFTFSILRFAGLLLFFGVACSSSCLVKNKEGFGYLALGSPSLKWFEHTNSHLPGWKFSLHLYPFLSSLFVFRKMVPFYCHYMTSFFYFVWVTLIIVAWANAAAIILSHFFLCENWIERKYYILEKLTIKSISS